MGEGGGMTFGLEKGQYSQADLNKSLKMVPKAREPYVLGEQSVCVGGRGGGMTFGLEKGQCSQADLNKSLKMVPKLVNPTF